MNISGANLRLYFQQGSGPNGGAGGRGCPSGIAGRNSVTTPHAWFSANATNVGGFSAICALTAQYLAELQPQVPVGAVESCVGGTNVQPWTPPNGSLWQAYMAPLVPMHFKLALWDQGEADAKRTTSKFYATEFPLMIERWRTAFSPAQPLPFFYVELCTEYGAEEPKEPDFWLAQRQALKLPQTGFATTTDIQRALHPPDKQDVARRLLLEIRRIAYGEPVISRGPEIISNPSPYDKPPQMLQCFKEFPAADPANNVCLGEYKDGKASGSAEDCAVACIADHLCLSFVAYHPATPGANTSCRFSHECTSPTSHYNMDSYFVVDRASPGCGGGGGNRTSITVTFSNESLAVHPGILVANTTVCDSASPLNGAVMAQGLPGSAPTPTPFTIDGAKVTIECRHGELLHINSDYTTCFLYGPHGLPAPPALLPCAEPV